MFQINTIWNTLEEQSQKLFLIWLHSIFVRRLLSAGQWRQIIFAKRDRNLQTAKQINCILIYETLEKWL